MFLFCLVFAMFCACLFICALWSPAGKGLTSWLSFVVSTVSLSLSHWYPGSGVVLDCIDSWSLHHYLPLLPESKNHEFLIRLRYRWVGSKKWSDWADTEAVINRVKRDQTVGLTRRSIRVSLYAQAFLFDLKLSSPLVLKKYCQGAVHACTCACIRK